MFTAHSSAVTVRPLEPGHRHAPSRRQFLAAGAGLGAAGFLGAQAIAAGPALAARAAGDPRPIPGGTQLLGPGTELFHVFPPGAGEPNTITDFNGFVGVAHIQGVGAGGNAGLSFDVDNRFITGEYIALDGRHFNATFGFLWFDIYRGPVGLPNQIHDFNPGIAASGLFWTTRVPDRSVAVSPGSGRATWMLENFEIPDFHDIVNSLTHGKPVGTGLVDMSMTWSGGGQVSHVRDTTNRFTGRKVTGTSHISWTVTMGDFSFTAAESSQTSLTSEVWKERNGVFFS
jgi:hypothetical protein